MSHKKKQQKYLQKKHIEKKDSEKLQDRENPVQVTLSKQESVKQAEKAEKKSEKSAQLSTESQQFEAVKNLFMLRKAEVGVLVVAFLFGVFYGWDTVEIFIFMIFIGIIVHPISSRLLAIPALMFLVSVPIFLHFEYEARAEEFAVYAYYFLVMAVMMGIYETFIAKESSQPKIKVPKNTPEHRY